MSDHDRNAVRSVLAAMVDEAPPPVSFDDIGIVVASPPRRSFRWSTAVAWGTTAAAAVVVAAVLVGSRPFDWGSRPDVSEYVEDGVITDQELETAWRDAEQCLIDQGIDADLAFMSGEWTIGLPSDDLDAEYDQCSRVSQELSRLYQLQSVPQGQARLEMAESLRTCLAEVGVMYVPYDPESPGDGSQIIRSAEEQLGYSHDDAVAASEEDPSVEPPWLDDPRFHHVLDCMRQHELLFPDRFGGSG